MKDKTEAANAGTFAASYKSPIFNQQTFDYDNYKSERTAETRRTGRVIKLFRCFECDRCYSANLMSGFLMICRNCQSSGHLENERERQRFVEKTLKKIGVFLRRRI